MKLNFKIVLKIFLFIYVISFTNCTSFKNDSLASKRLKTTKLSNCKVQLDDNTIVDLSSLDNPTKPRSDNDDSNEYTFNFNPCSPIVCDPKQPSTSAVCQKAIKGDVAYNCGDQDTVTFEYQDTLVLKYSSGSRKAILQCLCADEESFKFISERPINNYNIQFKSKCCCPDKCKGGKPSGGGSGGLSFGSVLLIIFFSLLIAYFLGGFIFLKFVRKSEGKEAIPNINFWVQLPSDVKGGVSYTFSRIRGNRNQYNQI